MKEPKIPPEEAERLRVLQDLEILDTDEEAAYDQLTGLVAKLLDVPIALISLVDADRQWFKSRVGLDARETPRAISFCGHVVADREGLVVRNAVDDERFADNPLVTGPPDIRFYAGIPLQVDNQVIGTLCAIDRRERVLEPGQEQALRVLAHQVEVQLELRRAVAATETARRLALEAAATERAFFELSLDLLCIANTQGYFERLNPRWTEVLGYELDELTSRPFLEFIHPDDRERTAAESAAAGKPGHETIGFVNRFLTRDGEERTLQWSARVDPQSGNIVAAARDITEARRTQLALERAGHEALAANRAKDEFLATMSHELRTPLNSVMGFANVLLRDRDGSLDARSRDYLQRIRNNGAHLLRLINDVLDLSKVEAGRIDVHLEDVDLTALVSDVATQLGGRAMDAGTRLSVTGPERSAGVRADAHRLRQVLINLVGNALKFARGGQVEIAVVGDEAGPPQRIDVVDDGTGIPAASLSRVFEPFRQVDEGTARQHGGTGLGLTIARTMCELMGLELRVASEEGAGALFSIVWPPGRAPVQWRAPRTGSGPKQAAPSDPAANARPAPGSRRVLIVDDSADARALLERHLEDYGVDIVAASSGAAGLQLARQLRPDLITLDLMMPDTDGWEFLRQCSADEALRTIPIVVTSIVAEESRNGLGAAAAILPKPLERGDLFHTLDEVFGGRRSRAVVLATTQGLPSRPTLAALIRSAHGEPHECRANAEAIARAVAEVAAGLIVIATDAKVDGVVELLVQTRALGSPSTIPIILASGRELDAEATARVEACGAEVLPAGNIERGCIRALIERHLVTGPSTET